MRDTAVQWYHNQIGFLFQQWHNHQITISEFHYKRLKLEQEAKEIEKNQMIEMAKEFTNIDGIENKDIEDYYNETYGGNK
jgi:predicted solute-binding protein